MTDIVAFISARLGETQAAAEAAQAVDPSPWHASVSGGGFPTSRSGHGSGLVVAADNVALWDCEGSSTLCMTLPTAEHIARHDPAHVLAEVKAKRAIVALHSPVWLVNQWVQDVDGKRHRGDLVVCRSCEPRTGFMTDQWPCDTLKLLAAPYADHPDYKQEWRADA